MVRYAQVAVPVPLKAEFTYSFDSDEMEIVPGVRVSVPFGTRRKQVQGYVVSVSDEKPQGDFEIKAVTRVIDKEPLFDSSDYKLALWMEKFYFSSRGEVLDTMIPGGRRDTAFGALDADEAMPRRDVVLSRDQENAVTTVMESDRQMFYVFGVTGSGKTEVFLRCAE